VISALFLKVISTNKGKRDVGSVLNWVRIQIRTLVCTLASKIRGVAITLPYISEVSS
jgi:hypothetical protein